jgi:hypothetical protein
MAALYQDNCCTVLGNVLSVASYQYAYHVHSSSILDAQYSSFALSNILRHRQNAHTLNLNAVGSNPLILRRGPCYTLQEGVTARDYLAYYPFIFAPIDAQGYAQGECPVSSRR